LIDELMIKGFKSFVNGHIKFSNLTLLTGLNNSGKSSVIQALRMYCSAFSGASPLLNGHGEVSDLRSDFVNANDDISVSLNFTDNKQGTMVLSNHEVINPLVGPEFFYVGADRLGPQSFLPMNLALDAKPKVGDRGEFVFDFIKRLEEYGYLLPDKMVHPASQGKTFEYVLQGWLTEIAPNVEFSFSTNKKADISHAEIDNYRPANVGFGLSYTLPIIAATLGAAAKAPTMTDQDSWVSQWEQSKSNNGVLLILENPEAHLHPQGQTAMGKMIALAATCGVQIVLETHSEHVMDGVRIAVKEGLVNSNEVKFHYLSKDKDGLTRIDTPKLDSDGKLDCWPNGFFDQTLKNRAILAKRKR
jgi:predicted ATPase